MVYSVYTRDRGSLSTRGRLSTSSLRAWHRRFPEIPTTSTRYNEYNVYSDPNSRFQDTQSDTSASTYAEQYAKRRYFYKNHAKLKNTIENPPINIILTYDDPEVKQKRKCRKSQIFGVN